MDRFEAVPAVSPERVCVAVIVNLETGRDKPDALERLTQLVRDDLDRVNELILQHMQSPVALIPQLAGHIIAAGGKRLRPVLTLAAARLCVHPVPRAVGLARAKEICMTGVPFTASEALAWGLVNRVVPQDELLNEVLEQEDYVRAISIRDEINKREHG